MEPDPVPCPDCESWEIELLKASKTNQTMRCTECGHVFKTTLATPKTVSVGLVISDGDQSDHTRIDVVTTDEIERGMEFEAEGMRLLLTGIEGTDGRMAEKAKGVDVKSLFAKRFDTVILKYTANDGPKTISLREEVDPDSVVGIGQTRTIEGQKLAVKTIKDDQNKTVRRGQVPARNVRRVFCDLVKDRKPEDRFRKPFGAKAKGRGPSRKR